MQILIATLAAGVVVGLVGILLGFFLGVSGEKFKVEVDPREEAICEVLLEVNDISFLTAF